MWRNHWGEPGMVRSTKTITFSVPGEVIPWSRAGRRGGVSFTPAKQGRFMATVGQYARIARNEAGWKILDEPVKLRIEATWLWPSRTPKKVTAAGMAPKATKPDLDNVIKIVKDAMNLIIYSDDSRVSDLSAKKRFGSTPGMIITIERF